MRIGLWLPTFAPDELAAADRDPIAAARRAEQLGFASLWTLDHVLPTEQVHSGSWYDPLIGLAAAAAVTEHIELGTAALVAGVRHPFALAKQLASLAALAGPRVTLGAGSGWMEAEYGVFGYGIRERRGRTDETLRAVRELLDRERVSFDGRYWRFADAALVPRPGWHLPIVVAGGSRAAEAGSAQDKPTMADSVLERIVAHDGWLAPCAGNEALTQSDLELVRARVEARERSRPFRYLHVQWTYVVDTDDHDEAIARQLEAFATVAGRGRSAEHLQAAYLMGTPDEIAARIARVARAGFDDLIVGPATAEPEQIERIAALAIPAAS